MAVNGSLRRESTHPARYYCAAQVLPAMMRAARIILTLYASGKYQAGLFRSYTAPRRRIT